MWRNESWLKKNIHWEWRVSEIDISGRQSFNTIFWDKVVARKVDNISIKFDLWILEAQAIKTELNWATATTSESRLFLQTWTATNWSVIINSIETVRYRPWHELFWYFTYAWPEWWIAGSKNFIGSFDDDNGYYIWYSWTDFVVWRRIWLVDNEQLRANFIDKLDWTWKSKMIIDTSKINIFRITFWYLWIAPATFEIYWGSAIGRVAFAVIDIINTSQKLTIESPNLPIRAEITKTSWATNITWYSWSWNGWYYNGWGSIVANIPSHYNTWAWIAMTWTWLEAVVNFRHKSTFNSLPSKVVAKMILNNFANTASWDIIVIYMIARPTTVWWVDPNSLSYTDVNTNRSTLEYSEWWWVIVWWTIVFAQYLVWWGWWSGKFSWEWWLETSELWLSGWPWDYFSVGFQRIDWSWAYTALCSFNFMELF